MISLFIRFFFFSW